MSEEGRGDRVLLSRLLLRVLHVLGRSLSVLLGLTSLAVAGCLFLLTQTVVGRSFAASFVQGALAGAVHGQVEVGPILGGNLLTHVVVASFGIRTNEGETFVALDSVRLSYNPIGFLTGHYRFRRVRAEKGLVRLLQDDQGGWNFDELFPGGGPPGGGPTIVLSDLEVEEGRLVMRTPWPTPGTTGAARDSALAQARRGESVWNLEQAPSGEWQRVVRLDSLHGRFPLVRLAQPGEPMKIEMEALRARALAVRQPLEVRRFDGEAVFSDTIQVAIRDLKLGHSEFSGTGGVVPSDPIWYHFDLEARPLGFADLQWLPVPTPKVGGGKADLLLFTRGPVQVVDLSKGDVRIRDSHVTGGFRLALSDTPRFESMDLDLQPMRVRTIDEILDRPELIDGYIRGPLRGSGPIDRLDIDAKLSLTDVAGETQASLVRAVGGVSMIEPYPVDSLRLQLASFEPRWTKVLGISTLLGGRLDGTATLSGSTAGRLSFAGDLRHRSAADSTSHLTGGGEIVVADTPSVDFHMTADPLRLGLLEPYLPNVDLVGAVRGPISANGRLSDLKASARLQTPRGHLEFDGSFDLMAERKSYDAQVLARGLHLNQWVANAPSTRLAVRGRVQGEGTDPASLAARFDLEILPSDVEGAKMDSSVLRFTMRDGLATVDTFALRSDVGTIDGRGTFGLSADKSGALVLDIDAPDVARWNRWLVPGRIATRPDTTLSDLFAGLPGGQGGAAAGGGEASPPDTLSGSLSARGTIYGNLDRFALGGRVAALAPAYGSLSADSIVGTLGEVNPRRLDSLVLRATAWKPSGPGVRLDSLFLRLERQGPVRSDLRLYGRRDTTVELRAAAGVEWSAQRRSARFRELALKAGRQELSLPGGDTALVAFGDSGLAVDDFVLAGRRGGEIRASGRVPDRGEADFQLALRQLSLGELADLLPSEPDLAGELSGKLRVRGTADAPTMEGSWTVTRPGFDSTSFSRFEGQLSYTDRRLQGRIGLYSDTSRLVGVEGSLHADLAMRKVDRRLLDHPVRATVSADSLPLALLELFTENLTDVKGYGRGSVQVTGAPGDLRYDGEARLTGASAWIPELDELYLLQWAHLRFQGTKAELDSVVVASASGGTMDVKGTVDLTKLQDPVFDLHFAARGLRAVNSRKMEFTMGGQGDLGGSLTKPTLSGKLRFSDGHMRIQSFLTGQGAVDLTNPEIMSLVDTSLVTERRLVARAQNPFVQNLKVDAEITVGPNFWLRSDQLSVELTGNVDVRMNRTQGDLTVFGPLHLRRGTYTFTLQSFNAYARQLTISDGTVEFVGTPGMNPNLDITAVYRTRTEQGQVTVTVHVGGTMLNTQLSLSSDPPMSQNDQVCFLLFSAPCVAVTGGGGGEVVSRGVQEQLLGAVGSQLSQMLVGGSWVDYVNLQSMGTGPTGTSQGSNSGFLSQSFLEGTEVELGRYIGQDLFVTVSQPLGSRFPGASIEWRFSQGWSLEGRTEYRFNPELSSSQGSNLNTQRLWGLFLYKEWSF